MWAIMTSQQPEVASRPISGSFAGKAAIVTGAGSAGDGIGNGRAAAILLVEQGAYVLCVDRDKEWAIYRRLLVLGIEKGV
ncbi:hypothetical protein VC83_04334 [Pseudogymnoascus destructans]|nr:uncharacterized protein VC83_04334 [Pseudogymnoascus destructans]OAF59193.1 hypothetical protein VC83_04334 [Pseudogymnoascus destructans]